MATITHSTCTSDGVVVKTSSSKPGKGRQVICIPAHRSADSVSG